MCPVCHESMFAFELDGVEVDHCVRCGGTWLDAGELERLTELAGAAPGRLAAALAASRRGRSRKRRCPRCRRRLREGTVDGANPVTIDRCPLGHGLWFDRGELLEVARAHAGGEDDRGAVARYFENLFEHELKPPASSD